MQHPLQQSAVPSCLPVALLAFLALQAASNSAAMQYIVDYYNDLPRWMVFVHGHNTSEHQPDKISVLRVRYPQLVQSSQHHGCLSSNW